MMARLKQPPPLPAPPPPRPFSSRDQRQGIDLTRAASTQQAVFRGMILYLQNPGLTVQTIWEKFRFDDDDETSPHLRDMCSISTFRGIASRQKWSAKRDEFWEGIEKRVLAEAETEIVKKELEEITVLEAIATKLQYEIVDGDAEPRSLEGIVNAFVTLDKHRMSKRERAMAAMLSGTRKDASNSADPNAPPLLEDGLSELEITTMARQIASQRAGSAEPQAQTVVQALPLADATTVDSDDEDWPDDSDLDSEPDNAL